MRVLAAVFTLAVGIGGARPITVADTGKTFRIARGEKVQLRLGAHRVWQEPVVGSTAVKLTAVYYFKYPGFQEWTVKAQRTGKATISAVGRTKGSPTRRFRVTLIVTP
jgi:hypothetical protein